jgi:hypothetical protein
MLYFSIVAVDVAIMDNHGHYDLTLAKTNLYIPHLLPNMPASVPTNTRSENLSDWFESRKHLLGNDSPALPFLN